MTWTCNLIEAKDIMHSSQLRVGDMFYAPRDYLGKEEGYEDSPLAWMFVYAKSYKLSEHYNQVNKSVRPPLLVQLPGKSIFCIDGMCIADGKYYGGWIVSGVAPNITVTPSINAQGVYHGYLTNGVLSDDCEGRKYDERGNQI